MENKLDLKFIYILGYAGHGKDMVKDLLRDHFIENSFNNLSFADTMKSQVAESLPSSIINIGKGNNLVEKLNDLKDNHHDVKVFENLNARRLLQVLGTEFYRSDILDPDIHVRFSAKKVLNVLEEGKLKNPVFASSDTRFPNELNFLLNASQHKEDTELKEFLKYFLQSSKKLSTLDDFVVHFKNTFKLENISNSHTNLLDRMWIDVEALKETPQTDRKFNFIIPETHKMKKEESVGYGMLHLFRPIVDPRKKLDAKMDSTDLMVKIKNYTQMTMGEIKSVRDNYRNYEVDFNADNVQKYGFLRADVKHYSEIAINDRKPEALISEPMSNLKAKEKFTTDLIELFKESEKPTLEVKKSFNTTNKRKI